MKEICFHLQFRRPTTT